MKNSLYPILPVALLLGLLILLAGLQYHWLGRISEGEREHMQKRLQTDTERFAEDFNREIQNAYFNFQISGENWKIKNWNQFNECYDFWRSKTAYPALIKDFYFIQNAQNAEPLHYNTGKRGFEEEQWTDELKKLHSKLTEEKGFDPFARDISALVMPLNEESRTFDRILIRSEKMAVPPIEMPEKYGFLIIKLDENTIRNQIFPDLVKKYFAENGNSDYKVVVIEEGIEPKVIFQNENENLNYADSTAKLFSLSPENMAFFVNKELLSTIHGEKGNFVLTEKMQTGEKVAATPSFEKKSTVKVELSGEAKPRVRVFESRNAPLGDGLWTLKVQHASGSLEQFVTNTRRKNLAMSFGILSLLAVSIVLIFVSAQRAKRFAQKQIDFVSSVSHEFRTPLAVIYSAGENLTDGVVRNENQVSKYGNLIKRKGKKLSEMVEQILEFAGARSGKRKYDFREIDVSLIVENALRECQPLIDEKGFTVKKQIAENLPKISGDFNALSHSIQNLINNSIKYSDGNKQIKISTGNGGGKVKITVEDKGIGISTGEIRHIFEPFYRSKKVIDEQIHGNGLGLSLVKQTVEAHGGKVSVESEIGKGSKFTIELRTANGNIVS